MTSNYIKSLVEYDQLSGIRFERFFRNRALLLECQEEINNEYVQELCENGSIVKQEIDLDKLQESPFSLFEDKESFYLLWLCHCINYKGKSLLSWINNYINNISGIQRGGINTYKRNGWTVHVLYVYQLVNYNFAYNIMPTAINWEFDAKYIFSSFFKEYNELSNTAKFVLKIACFIHDIGVQIAVNDHETLGVPLVKNSYEELKVTKQDLIGNGVYLSEEELLQVLEVIVGNHQIINQVAGEVSDYIIYTKVCQIRKKLSSKEASKFMVTEFSKVMYLLGAADMMAVDDSLLSNIKFDEIGEAKKYIQEIITNGNYGRNYRKYGIKRLKCLVNDDLKNVPDDTIIDLIKSYGCSCEELLKFMYEVQGISYGVAAIKPLNDLSLTVKFACVLYRMVSAHTIEYEHVFIKIDSGFEKEYIKELLAMPVEDINKKLIYHLMKKTMIYQFTVQLK